MTACYDLALMYANGEGVAKDVARAAELYQKACDGGHARGCTNLGFMHDKGEGVAKDFAKAAQLYQKACDGGDAQGCVNLGYDYANGEGVEKDVVRAAQLYQKACDGGSARGCLRLGHDYDNGQGVVKDVVKAAQLYQKACDGGNEQGCFNLGYDYAKGEGVVEDIAKAAQLYQKACDSGNAAGCTNLGLIYANGDGVAKDVAKATQLYQKACDGGNEQGCTNLGILHASAPPPAPTPGQQVAPPTAPRASGRAATQSPARSTTGRARPQAGTSAPHAVAPRPAFEVVATHTVTSARSSSEQVRFKENENGVVVVLRRTPATDKIAVHSTDFVLVLKSDSEIPRRRCIGISYGMKSTTEEVRWANVGSAEDLLRHSIEPGDPYFALLFPAPKSVSTFTLYGAAPLTPWLTLEGKAMPQVEPSAPQAVAGTRQPEFEVVSTQVVASARSALHEVGFGLGRNGMAVVLKRAPTADRTTVHSNDFVLLFKVADEDLVIPRGSCVGISYGMKSPDEEVRWPNVRLAISRYWIAPGEPYFGLLFSAPRNATAFSLAGAVPLSSWFTPAAQASASGTSGLTKECPNGDGDGCYSAGKTYELGSGVAQDKAKAAQLYRVACDAGHADACFALTHLHWAGAVTGWVENRKAFETFKRAVALDPKDAQRSNQLACDAGDVHSCLILAVMYDTGVGLEQDRPRARELFQRLCDRNDAGGCYNLGTMYLPGPGIVSDSKTAATILKKACGLGNAPSCNICGVLLKNTDKVRAVELLKKGCEGGDPHACKNLGFAYDEGVGVSQDREKAAALFAKACASGIADACVRR